MNLQKYIILNLKMHKTISLFCKGNITNIPPVYNYALALIDCGFYVKLYVGEAQDETIQFLLAHGEGRLQITNFKLENKNKLKKWMEFRKLAIQNLDYSTIVWYATLDTAIVMYGKHLKANKFIISVLELYDSATSYTRFFLKKILPLADKVIVPEYNRAAILKTWYNLRDIPFVLPNKPYKIELLHESDNIKELKEKISTFANGRKILIYQGLITPERNIDNIIKAVEYLKNDVCIILMGTDFNYVDHLINIGGEKQVLYIGNISSPNHLLLTSFADIGIVSYNYIDLNNIFCAPNKIWEYAAFNKAMLGNDVPGLKYMIEYHNAGICVNTEILENIIEGLKKIVANYSEFSANSQKFFNSFDLKDALYGILNEENCDYSIKNTYED